MIVNPWVIKVCLKTRDGKTVPVTYKGTGWVDTILLNVLDAADRLP